MIKIPNIDRGVIMLVVGAVLALLVYISFFQPIPEPPGYTDEEIEALRKENELSTTRYDSLSAEQQSVQKEREYYRRLYLSKNRELQSALNNIPEEPLDINLKVLTFEEKVDLFNEITEQ